MTNDESSDAQARAGLRSAAYLGAYDAAVDAALRQMARQRILARIWEHDHTVWAAEAAEVSDRLGWLHSPDVMANEAGRLHEFAAGLRREGFQNALLLGMGGSSLAAGVFRECIGVRQGYLDLRVLDSTDPGAMRSAEEGLDLTTTLFIVASKSGGTVETLSLFKYFYNQVAFNLGEEHAGRRFIAITDPGSGLSETSRKLGFRETFLNDPEIGGRYSALSFFGLVPAALMGIDIASLLSRARREALDHSGESAGVHAPRGVELGAILGELAKAGRDKLTFVCQPAIASLGQWLEQLLAESTGKEGKGILPVVNEPLGAPNAYGRDRAFVVVSLGGDFDFDREVKAIEEAGNPVVRLDVPDPHALGGEMFVWELATAVAGHRLGINPFNQPNVEAAKILARQMIADYRESGALPVDEPTPLSGDALTALLGHADHGDPESGMGRSYVALQAYVAPSAEIDARLQQLRASLRDRTRLATTVGYGPRYLHSTGQLHKGDAGSGLFIVLTSASGPDVAIPNEAGRRDASVSFRLLERAQALGDKRALERAGRRVVRFDLKDDVVGGIEALSRSLD